MRICNICVGFLTLVACAGVANAGIVQGTEEPQLTNVTNQLAMSHGVIFNSNFGFVTFGVNGASTIGIYGTESWANPMGNYSWYGAPIEITFVDMSDGISPAVVNGTISAVFGDGGGDTDGIRLRAYDINNNLIGTQTALTVGFGPISITGVGIRRIVFDQSGLGDPTSDTFLDWVSFPTPTPLPVPGTAMLGALAIGLGARRSRRCV